MKKSIKAKEATAENLGEKHQNGTHKVSPEAQKAAAESLSGISRDAADVDKASTSSIGGAFEEFVDFQKKAFNFSESSSEREKIIDITHQALNKSIEGILEINKNNLMLRKGLILAVTAIAASGAYLWISKRNEK